jgi:SAM-dependent methyltransferase
MLSIAARDRVRSSFPWWAKCALKLALVRMPVNYRALRAISLARHGGMQRPSYAFDIFRRHFDAIDFRNKGGGFNLLELGPGDALSTAVIAKAHGASSTCHVDVRPYATRDPAVYKRVAQLVAERGLAPPDLSLARSFEDVLQACSARYETAGLASLRDLPDASFDFILSNSVLQCVPPRELPETMAELRRVLHPLGACVHSIDLRDMMGQSLNHLRFTERVWESRWFRRAGFHTNRLRYPEWVAVFRAAGFETKVLEANRWASLPVARESLAAPFRGMAESDLLIATLCIVLRPDGALRRAEDNVQSEWHGSGAGAGAGAAA